jgi:general secretion pathway protein C
MSARWFTFLVWAAVAASAVAWSLKVFVSPPTVATNAPVAGAGAAVAGDVSRVLGAEKVAPPATLAEVAAAPTDGRFQLLGVVAPRGAGSARSAVALIAVEGKTARAYRTGAVVDGDWVVQNVRARSVDLGAAGKGAKALMTLELPPLAGPAMGTPSTFATGNAGAAPGANPGVMPGAMPGAGMPGMPNAAPNPATPPMPGNRPVMPTRLQAPAPTAPPQMPSMPGANTSAPTRNGLPKPPPGDGGTGHPPMQMPGHPPGAALQ